MALLWKMICNVGDPMSLGHPVPHLSAQDARCQSVDVNYVRCSVLQCAAACCSVLQSIESESVHPQIHLESCSHSASMPTISSLQKMSYGVAMIRSPQLAGLLCKNIFAKVFFSKEPRQCREPFNSLTVPPCSSSLFLFFG